MKIKDIYTDQFYFTQEDLTNFCNLVGDINPIHRDKFFANKEGFKNCIVQGLFAVSVFSARASMLMPPFIEAIECSREIKFIRPVLVEEKVLLSCEIIDINKTNRIGIVREKLKNSKGQICIDSTVKTQLLKIE
ncbi:MaoC/PaaZ C-terminal domain-containing protein [Parabacteroides segnis]|uniref:MaoC/PaaZ C-terminal domain-containing protein n=1 Tax=Parabacteroides segnis TaxID=2763058 RepID=UPI00351437EF